MNRPKSVIANRVTSKIRLPLSVTDSSTVEIGKSPTTTKVKDDHSKLLLESKAILENLIIKFNYIDPTTIKISSLQLCGLKGDLLISEMKKPKSIVATRATNRIRIPLCITDSSTTIQLMKQVLFYRNEIIETIDQIKSKINENNDRRRSFEEKTLQKKTTTTTTTYEGWVSY